VIIEARDLATLVVDDFSGAQDLEVTSGGNHCT
jgi:hypothetical protein